MKRLILVATLLLGSVAFAPQQGRIPEEDVFMRCPPGTPAGTYVSTTDTYYFGQGDSPARIAESYHSPRWQAFLDLNPYLRSRISFNRKVGNRTYAAYASVRPCEPLRGLRELGLTPADLAPSAATAAEAVPPPQTVTVAVVPWWVWLLPVLPFIAVVIMLLNRRRLKRDIAKVDEVLMPRAEHDRRICLISDDHERKLAEQRAEYEDQLAFARRRGRMPPLPESVEDAVFLGPPVRPEGLTDENRMQVLGEAVEAAYLRLHPGAETDGLGFERRNGQRVLISSRPGETFMMIFGDNVPREVMLVREPGWIFDAVIRRGEEIIQELEGICVVSFCANAFEYRRSWIVGALVEPYEETAVHTVPDWGTVETAPTSRQITLASADGRIVAIVDGEPMIDVAHILIETKGDIRHEGDALVADGSIRLSPSKARSEVSAS